MSIATAKQIDCAPKMIAVLTPITSPRESSSGPPELPGIQCRVGLDYVGDQTPGACAHAASERADDAGSYGVLKAHRVADRDCYLTALEPARRAERGVREAAARHAVDGQNGEVGVRIVADPAGREFAAVAQRNVILQPGGPATIARARARHVRIGEEIAVRREQETRATASARRTVCGLNLYRSDAGTDAVDHSADRVGIGVEQEAVMSAQDAPPKASSLGRGTALQVVRFTATRPTPRGAVCPARACVFPNARPLRRRNTRASPSSRTARRRRPPIRRRRTPAAIPLDYCG